MCQYIFTYSHFLEVRQLVLAALLETIIQGAVLVREIQVQVQAQVQVQVHPVQARIPDPIINQTQLPLAAPPLIDTFRNGASVL